MILWRIEYRQHVNESLSGTGARRYGGRWNLKGTAVAYLSSSLSLAAFEKFVHAQPASKQVALLAVSVDVPDELMSGAQRPKPLPVGWRDPAPAPTTMRWGTGWADSRASAVAIVPSVLLPLESFEQHSEYNAILNPEHPEAKAARVVGLIPYAFDPRLWKA